jgi:uncharacterized membrane protein
MARAGHPGCTWRMQRLTTPILLAATISMGLMAGLFAIFANGIMPGLAGTDDRTFVNAFHAFDEAMVNPWFVVAGFLGALVLTIVAAVLNRRTAAFGWILGAGALYLVTFVVTVAIHLPLNAELNAASELASAADLGTLRDRFDEPTWNAWNIVRALATIAAFGSLTWALVLRGRVSAPATAG